MTRHFGYFDDWKTPILECPQCGWKGTFMQGSYDYFSEVMDSSCPQCDKMLAVVSYATIEESKAHPDKLTSKEKKRVSARERFLAEWEAASLKSADQLPDLEGPTLTFVWDMIEGKRKFTVIRHGDNEIWRELAVYEGYERFGEVVTILKEKYGPRLLDVVPSDASRLYLHGDSIPSIDTVEELRASLRRYV